MFPPADRSPMRNSSSVFFFFCSFAFCLVELLPSRLVFSFVIPPHLSSEISFISFSIFFFFFFFFNPLCTKRRSVGGGEGAEIRRKTEDKGCTLSSFCFRVSKARSPAWLPCELLCEGARRHSPRPVKHCSLFFLSPPIVASHEERYSAEEEKVPVYSGAVFVFVQLCILCFERSPRRRAPHFNISSLILRLCNSR